MYGEPIKANVVNLCETDRTYGRHESGFYREIAVLSPADGHAIVTARIYWPGQTAYCALWISDKTRYGRGQGKAGGGGYHKASAALADAIKDAGVELDRSISGVGDAAMEQACEAIARALTGKRRFIVHVAHA